ncbi:protein-serine O-palmitoleoyltransferase porcupine-like [Styela clava]
MDVDLATMDYYDNANLPDDYTYYDEQYPVVRVEDRVEYFNIKEELKNLVENCMGTVVLQSANQLGILLLSCLIFRIIARLSFIFASSFPNLRITLLHILGIMLGFVALYSINHETFYTVVFVMLIYIFLTYIIFHIFCNFKLTCGRVVSVLTVLYLFSGELLISVPQHWNQIRGVLLLLSMKSISLAFSLDNKNVLKPPSVFSYMGYCMHSGTLVFGPWVEYKDYVNSVLQPKPITFTWIFHVIKSLFFACICLLLSTCLLSYLFIDATQPELPSITPFVANYWMLSYKSAISLHFSHFYICYLSQTTCMLSGIGSEKHSDNQVWSEFSITKPFAVEIPTSMLNVVVAWNMQTSKWLKEYVFDASKSLGRKMSVLLTYVASAMLHGLSFHLAAVLLSLAFYTYVEYNLRKKISLVFNCPYVQSRPKKSEVQSAVPLWAYAFNFMWILINLMHLAYLGAIFQSEDETIAKEGYPMKHTIEKWANLNFFSHIFAFACFIFNSLM